LVAAGGDDEERLSMQPGDVLLLDGRTIHRGLANNTPHGTPARLMCFCTFQQPGLTDGNQAAYVELEEQEERGGRAGRGERRQGQRVGRDAGERAGKHGKKKYDKRAKHR
jgi:hypothetical protein